MILIMKKYTLFHIERVYQRKSAWMSDDAKQFNWNDNTYLNVRYLKRFIDKNQY